MRYVSQCALKLCVSEHFRKQAKPADHPGVFLRHPMAFHPEEDHRRRQKETEEHTEWSPRRRWTRIFFFFCSPPSLEPKFCLNESDFFFFFFFSCQPMTQCFSSSITTRTSHGSWLSAVVTTRTPQSPAHCPTSSLFQPLPVPPKSFSNIHPCRNTLNTFSLP